MMVRPETVAVLVYSLCFVAMLLMVCMMCSKLCRMTYDFEAVNRQLELHKLNEHGKRGTSRPNICQVVNEETQV